MFCCPLPSLTMVEVLEPAVTLTTSPPLPLSLPTPVWLTPRLETGGHPLVPPTADPCQKARDLTPPPRKNLRPILTPFTHHTHTMVISTDAIQFTLYHIASHLMATPHLPLARATLSEGARGDTRTENGRGRTAGDTTSTHGTTILNTYPSESGPRRGTVQRFSQRTKSGESLSLHRSQGRSHCLPM